jgi:MFS family permease
VIAAGGAFGYAVALALFALGGSFAALAVAAFVLGMSSTAMVDAAEVALVELAGDDLRRALARSNLLATVGDLLGPGLVLAVAATGLSWRVAFGAGALVLAAYGVALAAAPLPRPAGRGHGDGGGGRPGLSAVLRDPAVWTLGVIGLLMNPFDEPLAGFTIALLEQERGASAAAASLVALADDLLLAGAAAAMTAAALTIAFVPVLPVVALAALVASVGLSLAWLAVQHRSLTLRPGQVGTTKAVLGTIESTGFWIPVAVGALADGAGLTAALASYGALGAVMVVLARWSGRRAATGASAPAPR